MNYGNGIYLPTEAAALNSFVNSAGLILTYAYNHQTDLSLYYNFTMRTLENDDDYFKNSVLLGLKHYFTEQIFAEGIGGIDVIRTFDKENLVKPYAKLSNKRGARRNFKCLYSL